MAEYLSKEDMSTGEYISRDEALKAMQYCCKNCNNYNGAMCRACDNADEMDKICNIPAADVQPLSVVAEHIKNRLYETAFNEPDTVARNAIVDMAGRIDFWINELAAALIGEDGDAE